MDDFRQFIVARMKQIGLNQNQLAQKAKKTRGWISKFLSGESRELYIDSFVDLAKALDISPVELMRIYTGEKPNMDSEYKRAVYLLLKALPQEVISEWQAEELR